MTSCSSASVCVGKCIALHVDEDMLTSGYKQPAEVATEKHQWQQQQSNMLKSEWSPCMRSGALQQQHLCAGKGLEHQVVARVRPCWAW